MGCFLASLLPDEGAWKLHPAGKPVEITIPSPDSLAVYRHGLQIKAKVGHQQYVIHDATGPGIKILDYVAQTPLHLLSGDILNRFHRSTNEFLGEQTIFTHTQLVIVFGSFVPFHSIPSLRFDSIPVHSIPFHHIPFHSISFRSM